MIPAMLDAVFWIFGLLFFGLHASTALVVLFNKGLLAFLHLLPESKYVFGFCCANARDSSALRPPASMLVKEHEKLGVMKSKQ